jgi:hypothetical protein
MFKLPAVAESALCVVVVVAGPCHDLATGWGNAGGVCGWTLLPPVSVAEPSFGFRACVVAVSRSQGDAVVVAAAAAVGAPPQCPAAPPTLLPRCSAVVVGTVSNGTRPAGGTVSCRPKVVVGCAALAVLGPDVVATPRSLGEPGG